MEFKNEIKRDSGVIYKSTFEQIKKLYAKNPVQAGELAIAAIELVLTDNISSDDFMIDLLLENNRVLNQKNTERYEKRVETTKQKRIDNLKLDVIAGMLLKGMRQVEIGAALKLDKSIVSKRVKIIREEYPELLGIESEELKSCKSCQSLQHDNGNDNDNVNDNGTAIIGYEVSALQAETSYAEKTFRF